MKSLARLALAGVVLTAVSPAWAGEVRVSFSNGLVTIIATDASPRQVLVEWAKLGQVRIMNLERLSGAPVTLQMTDVPEAQALETLLRGTAGYVAAPRAASADTTARLSCYDRILLMPGTAPAMPPPSSGPSAQPGRGRQVIQTHNPADDDREMPEPSRTMPGPNGMAREVQRPGGAPVPGQAVRPGQTIAPGQSISPGQFVQQGSAYQPGGAYQQASPYQQNSPYAGTSTPGSQAYPGASRQVPNPQMSPGASAAVPGMPTSPIPIPTTPYSNAGPPARAEDVWQNQNAAGQAPASAARPGESTAPTPGMFRNPYGLPEPIRPPVTDPNANPYGLPSTTKTPANTPGTTTPGATTPGATTAPPAPIKKNPGGEG